MKKKMLKDTNKRYGTQSQISFKEENRHSHAVETDKIPNELPQNTKKFIEPQTKEVLYLTSEGRMYTEDRLGKLKQIYDLKPLFPKKINTKLGKKRGHTKNYLSEQMPKMTFTNERAFS